LASRKTKLHADVSAGMDAAISVDWLLPGKALCEELG
jgi:hypothetical protein